MVCFADLGATSNCDFYHTEKAYKGLLAGSIPVYIGADTAKTHGYFPPHSVLFMSDYSSPAELAKHMLYLAGNSTAYAEYMAWRYKPIPDVLKKRLGNAREQKHGLSFSLYFLFARSRVEPALAQGLLRHVRLAARELEQQRDAIQGAGAPWVLSSCTQTKKEKQNSSFFTFMARSQHATRRPE